MQSPPKIIPVFLVLAGVFSSVFYAFIILSGSMQPYALGLMWCPGVAAIISQLLFRRTLRGLGWPPGGLRYLLMSYGLPVIYAGSVYGIVWLTGLGSLSPADIAAQVATQTGRDVGGPGMPVALYVLVMATVGFSVNCGAALGEEIGWRGLLVPELAKRTSFTATALISGGIWAVWHTILGFSSPTIVMRTFPSGLVWPASLCWCLGSVFPLRGCG